MAKSNLKMINLKCRKCHKNFDDCKCEDKYLRYSKQKQHQKNKKGKNILIILLITLTLLILISSIALSIEINNKENSQPHSKVIYSDIPTLPKTPQKPCPCLQH